VTKEQVKRHFQVKKIFCYFENQFLKPEKGAELAVSIPKGTRLSKAIPRVLSNLEEIDGNKVRLGKDISQRVIEDIEFGIEKINKSGSEAMKVSFRSVTHFRRISHNRNKSYCKVEDRRAKRRIDFSFENSLFFIFLTPSERFAFIGIVSLDDIIDSIVSACCKMIH
jgi:hypothetical protein